MAFSFCKQAQRALLGGAVDAVARFTQDPWDSLQIPDEEKYRMEHPWKDKVFYVEWRTKDQRNVKVYDQKRAVEYADYKVGLFYISPFDLFVEGEPVITKVEKRKSRSPSE